VLVGVAMLSRPTPLWNAAAGLMLAGLLIFSGCLYGLVLTGPSFRWLGAVVPIGGVSLIIGWVLLAVGAWRAN
jgi:uncharacterized membrane protein YgdD (TMEM256/DUF423 family)